MKRLAVTATALLLLTAAPALATSCCAGGEGKAALCGKGGTAMTTTGKTGCCEGMGGAMSKRA